MQRVVTEVPVQQLDIRSNFPTNRPFYVINVAMINLAASASGVLAPALTRHSLLPSCPTFASRVKGSVKLVQQVQHMQQVQHTQQVQHRQQMQRRLLKRHQVRRVDVCVTRWQPSSKLQRVGFICRRKTTLTTPCKATQENGATFAAPLIVLTLDVGRRILC